MIHLVLGKSGTVHSNVFSAVGGQTQIVPSVPKFKPVEWVVITGAQKRNFAVFVAHDKWLQLVMSVKGAIKMLTVCMAHQNKTIGYRKQISERKSFCT